MSRRNPAALTGVLSLALLFACKPPNLWKLVPGIDLKSAGGAPQIAKIDDLGSVPLIPNKPLAHERADGVAVAGELLVIRGKNFGRLPQVSFGQKPVAIEARTEDGGIVVRTPSGIAPGDVTVGITTDRGTATRPMKVRRYALATVPGVRGVQVLDVGASAVKPSGTILATAPQFIAFDRYGSVAYITTQSVPRPRLLVVDMARAGGPADMNQIQLAASKVLGMAAASHAKRLAVVQESVILVFDLDEPRRPYRFAPVRFPRGLLKAGVGGVALSPDGKTLAVLVQNKNAIVLFDIKDPTQVRKTDPIPLLPEAKADLLRGFRFSYERGSALPQILWVMVGDTVASQKVGKHPPKLLKVGIKSTPDFVSLPEAKILGEVKLAGEHTPLAMAATYAIKQVASATVLRRDPSTMMFFVGAVHPDLLMLDTHRLDTPTGLQQGAELVQRLGKLGRVSRVDHQGQADDVHETGAVPASLDVSADGQFLLALTCKPSATTSPPNVEVDCGVLFRGNAGKGPASFLKLGKLPKSSFLPPFRFGMIAIPGPLPGQPAR